jgi:hypothetical protein
MSSSELAEGAACAPNISGVGRRRRKRIAGVAAAFAVVMLGIVIASDSPWWTRALVVFFPALVASTSYLEAQSHVCVLRAAQGTYEHDDRSKTAMDASLLPAIRRVATSVGVKALLFTGVATLLATLTVRVM